ncbi:MAG TPA: BON domain-containing protein [Burkholderiales bacterium]|nr:BON domain-containing protein [Burkholderiales bacterium]
MNFSDGAGIRRARIAAIAGVVALSAASCAQDGPSGDIDRAANLSGDPIERMIAESQRATAEMRELAGREPARSGRKVQDASISARVASALFAEPVLRAAEIHVRTNGSVVTLDGVTDTPQGRTRAAQVAMNVHGVRSVHNHLVVLEDS